MPLAKIGKPLFDYFSARWQEPGTRRGAAGAFVGVTLITLCGPGPTPLWDTINAIGYGAGIFLVVAGGLWILTPDWWREEFCRGDSRSGRGAVAKEDE